jgi:hypothetical protein
VSSDFGNTAVRQPGQVTTGIAAAYHIARHRNIMRTTTSKPSIGTSTRLCAAAVASAAPARKCHAEKNQQQFHVFG